MFDDPRMSLAVEIAREAGRIALEYFRSGSYQVDRKPDLSPVTAADRRAEEMLRQRIEEKFSDDAILGEEYGQSAGNSGYRWILDPIDGTKSFISGVPLFGTLVGLQKDGENIGGVIEIPALDQRIFALRDQGAWYQSGSEREVVQAGVSQCQQLSEGLLLTSEFEGWAERGVTDLLWQLEKKAWFTRTWGDCFGYLMVATGRAVLMVDPVMNLWDAAAVQPILEEAGGTFTDWQGNATADGGEGIGTNGKVLEEVLEVLRP